MWQETVATILKYSPDISPEQWYSLETEWRPISDLKVRQKIIDV